MSVPREEFNALVERVEVLETWAGPGQAEALAQTIKSTRDDVKDIRSRVKKIEKTLEGHTVLLREILDRLPSK
ncbi:MAG: hypothetical protein HOV86_32135 [Thermoactinospora sp.]|nr:hypothetical protein [Thermoactinospora sp.]